MAKKISLALFLIAIIAAAAFFVVRDRINYSPQDLSKYNTAPLSSKNNSPQNSDPLPQNIVIDVPFQAQAPFGDWSDPKEQAGCEEESMIMAAYAIQKKSLSPEAALQQIQSIADFEDKEVGTFYDTSVEDTAKVYNSYFQNAGHAEARRNITVSDIKYELAHGRIVLVPTNGQKLGNPYYKQPGPLTHMLVLRGYDDAKGIFITNDPGTKRGEGYIYDYNVVLNADTDYPTGHENPVTSSAKVMIVISND